MMLFRSLWLVLPLLLSACGGGGSGKGFPVDHCVANCVTGNERLQIEPAQGTLIPGATQQLYALLFDGDHIEREVTGEVVWQSANPAIATVNAQGQVSALAVGTTEISARLGGSLQAAVLIKVIDTAITALQIVPANQLSTPGLSHQYHALALLGSGLQVDVTNSVNWSISNEVVASVSAQGRVSALAVGMTQIQASLQTFTASAHLLVVAPNQAELRITPADLSTPAGTAALFSATLLLGEKELDVSEMVQWQSSNLAVAEFSTPSTPGLASAKVAGSVVISASLSYGGQSLTALAQLQVTQAQVTRVRVTPASLSLPIGARQPLQAIADFSDGSSKDVTYAATWSSADAAVASVTNLTTQKAWVRAVAAGSTRISASYAGFSDAAEVEVTDARLLLLSLNPQSAVVSADVQLSYSLLAHFSDGSRRDVTKAALFSSSEPEVAVIESGGSRAGLATAISAGTTSILASYQSQQVRVSLTVLAQDVSPRSLSLTPVQAELLAGSKLQYRALLTLSNGHQQDVTGSVRWLSSDANIAAVNEQGLASAISSGSAEIGVYLPLLRIPALRAVARLQVVESEVVALHLQPSSKLSVPGLEHQYSAFAQLDSGALVNVSDQVDWSVSNSSVVRIDDNGLLNTLSAGRSDIIAAMGAQRTSAVIQVIDSSSVSLAITPASASAPAGTELQFNALLTVGAQQLDVTDQVIWRSGAPQVADFIQAQEPGLITALRQGVGLIGASFIYKGVALTAAAQMNVSAAVATALRVKPANLTLSLIHI